MDSTVFEAIYVGFMIFKEGSFYVGYFNRNYKFEGEGMFFFSVGALIRGDFINGKIQGKALISLPNNILLIASFLHGKLVEEFGQLNQELRDLTQQQNQRDNPISHNGRVGLEKNILLTLREEFNNSRNIEDQQSFMKAQLSFGCFKEKLPKEIHIGFLKDAEPHGWGIKLKYDLNSLR